MDTTLLFSSNEHQQRITSLDIAKVINKPHNDVMKAIRKMEQAWAKVTQGNFSLSSYKDSTGRVLPCYSLTRLETLFIATKFNDEARAKLVIYCHQLEEQVKARMQSELVYMNEVLKSENTLTTTMIAKEFDLTAYQVNRILHDEGVIFPQSGQWFLYAMHHGKDLVDYETWPDFENGHHTTHRQMRWTETGHRFVVDVVSNHLLRKALAMRPRYVEASIAFVFI